MHTYKNIGQRKPPKEGNRDKIIFFYKDLPVTDRNTQN